MSDMVRSREFLRQQLRRIDGKGYGFYRDLAGTYDLDFFSLTVARVQADPFAPPTRLRVAIPWGVSGWDDGFLADGPRRRAFEDYLARAFRDSAGEGGGTGRVGRITIDCNGQAVLRRNAVVASRELLEARCAVELPARGRRILGRQAEELLLEELPGIVSRSLLAASAAPGSLDHHVRSVEDQVFLRRWIADHGYVAFVADGSVLPRRSGVDDRPFPGGGEGEPLVRFRSPDSLAAVVDLPGGRSLRGMAVAQGVTLIVGGGFHGKSTLLSALCRGVYDHIPGDGRERVVTDPTAVKVRAEDGRSVAGVDLRPLIRNLPWGRTTDAFATQNASGSTSQAAGIMEALEVGTRVLLMDEDTCATNMMIRDARMRAVVPDDREPIVPFVDRVRALHREHGVSTILVMGGAGDYLGVADTVIMMDSYEVRDVTERARATGAPDHPAGLATFGRIGQRRPDPSCLDPSRGRRTAAIDAKGRSILKYGQQTVDLSLVEQLIDQGQTRAIGWLIRRYAESGAGEAGMISEGLRRVFGEVEVGGLDILDSRRDGRLAMPRIQEVAAALNRMRNLRILRSGDD